MALEPEPKSVDEIREARDFQSNVKEELLWAEDLAAELGKRKPTLEEYLNSPALDRNFVLVVKRALEERQLIGRIEGLNFAVGEGGLEDTPTAKHLKTSPERFKSHMEEVRDHRRRLAKFLITPPAPGEPRGILD